MWSNIVGKKEIVMDNEKIIPNKKFDEPFNKEFTNYMISFLDLPKDLCRIVEEYLQPVFNPYRYKIPKSLPYSFYRSLNIDRTYKGYDFYKRFNIYDIYNVNHYRFKINFHKMKSDFGQYYDMNVELFHRSDDWFCYKYSLAFPVKDLDYLCQFSHKKSDDVTLFMNYFVKLKKANHRGMFSTVNSINFRMINDFKFYETLVVWNKVFKDVCLYFR